MVEENQQQVLYKLSTLEQRIQELQQQLQAIDNGTKELNSLNLGLNEIPGSEGKEILAQIGRGIFIKAKILSEELFVDVGEKKFVKKNIAQTKETIDGQIKKLQEVREELENNLQDMSKEFSNIIEQYQNKQS